MFAGQRVILMQQDFREALNGNVEIRGAIGEPVNVHAGQLLLFAEADNRQPARDFIF